ERGHRCDHPSARGRRLSVLAKAQSHRRGGLELVMDHRPRRTLCALVLLAAIACTADDSNVVRGRGLAVASLQPATEARIYRAAVHAAFDVDESLWLLLDPRLLPRVTGLAADGRVPAAVTAALTSDGVIRGSCEPPLHGSPGVPHCAAERPGYV